MKKVSEYLRSIERTLEKSPIRSGSSATLLRADLIMASDSEWHRWSLGFKVFCKIKPKLLLWLNMLLHLASASIKSHITAQFYKITNHLCLNLIYLWFLEWTSDINRKRPPPLTLDGSVLITVSLRWIPPMFELHRRLRSLKQSSLCSSNLFIKQYSLQTHVYPSIFFTIKFSIKSVAEFNKILKE